MCALFVSMSDAEMHQLALISRVIFLSERYSGGNGIDGDPINVGSRRLQVTS